MNTKIRAAMQRLRRVQAGESATVVYNGDCRSECGFNLRENDQAIVSAYVCDPRQLSALSDDEWREMGFVRNGDDWQFAFRYRDNWRDGSVDYCMETVFVGSTRFLYKPTVGQLRCLVAALEGV